MRSASSTLRPHGWTADGNSQSNRSTVTPSTTARSGGFNYEAGPVSERRNGYLLTHNQTKLHRQQIAAFRAFALIVDQALE